ncbi:MAG: thioredoxin fold domain-containing protein, partial [Oceanicoccus sp.]
MKQFPRLLIILLSVSIGLISTVSFAQQPALNPAAASAEKIIRAAFKSSRPELRIETITASEIPGLYSVQISNGPVLYSTADGKHFVLGDLYQVGANGFINLAEKAREGGRAKLMAGVSDRDMIIFSPKKPAKAAIMVFTDVDCFYCQKLHQEVPDLNRLGIEVRYLAYPRAGIGSDSYKKIVSAWCAKDRHEAMNKLKRRERIAANVCAENPVAEQFKLGGQVGVTGTPALVTTEGRLMPGYMPALQLANALGIDVDPVIAAELERKQALEK